MHLCLKSPLHALPLVFPKYSVSIDALGQPVWAHASRIARLKHHTQEGHGWIIQATPIYLIRLSMSAEFLAESKETSVRTRSKYNFCFNI